MGAGMSPYPGRMHQLVGSFFNRHAVIQLHFWYSSHAASQRVKAYFTFWLPYTFNIKSGAGLRLLVRIWFQIYFTPLTGVLFTFPSRYWFTIDLQIYLALPVSSGGFPRAIRVPRYSRTTARKIFCFRLQGYYLLGPGFPARSANKIFFNFPSKLRRCRTTPSTNFGIVALCFCNFCYKISISHRMRRLSMKIIYNKNTMPKLVLGLGFSRFARRY